jgi:L-fuconolactonase
MKNKLIDTHLHLWDVEKLKYPWLDEVKDIRKSFDIKDYQEATALIPIEKMIFVQCECLAEQYMDEVNYVSEIAIYDRRIAGIISWFPLELPDAETHLQILLKNPLIRGIRRLEESPISLYASYEFTDNLALLQKYHLSFDIGVKTWQLPQAVTIVERQPEIQYMLDHCGKPDIKNAEMLQWKANIRLLADNPNVYCKISGLVTEAKWNNWQVDDLRPYFDFIVEQFGFNRIVFGSDWPVVNLASNYADWFEAFLALCKDFTSEEMANILFRNASRFYRI